MGYPYYYLFLKIKIKTIFFRIRNQHFIREFILQAREYSRDASSYPQDGSSTHMESYMEYLALLNHRHGQYFNTHFIRLIYTGICLYIPVFVYSIA